MVFRPLFVTIALSLAWYGLSARAEPGPGYEPKLYEGLLPSLRDAFTGDGLALQLAALGITAIGVGSGLDGHAHRAFRQDQSTFMAPAYVIGSGLVATAAFIPLVWAGKVKKQPRWVGAGYAVLQASVVTLAYVTVLKFLTGRPAPDSLSSVDSFKQSEQFNFGAGRGGVINGWPSGHVSHTVAVTAALAHYYSDEPWLTWLGVGLSAYVFVGMLTFDAGQMHWLTDLSAGALMGYAIGSNVGRNLRDVVEERTGAESPSVSWAPVVAGGGAGASLTYRF